MLTVRRSTIWLFAGFAVAQLSPGQMASAQKPALKIPAKERVTLTTKDGIQISCDYYAGGFQKTADTIKQINGKSVMPVILVHGFGGQGSDYDGFATALQSLGHAVAVPDLRGHGRSLTAKTIRGNVDLVVDRFKPADFAAMILDIEAVKKFLLQKNNEQALNIELLAIVGSDMGALVALNWAVRDWSWQQLPAFKQGRDVKVLVLLSPPDSFRGMTTRRALENPVIKSQLPVLIAVGAKDDAAVKSADRLYRFFERAHANPEDSVGYLSADTTLQGAQLLNGRGLSVNVNVATFLHHHLVDQAANYPWTDRKNPLGESAEPQP